MPEEELVDSLVRELDKIAAEDAVLIAAGKTLPVGIPEV